MIAWMPLTSGYPLIQTNTYSSIGSDDDNNIASNEADNAIDSNHDGVGDEADSDVDSNVDKENEIPMVFSMRFIH